MALTAIRDSETAAESIGISTRRVEFLIYAGTAAMTGLTVAFPFLQKLRITPDAAFSVNDWTGFVIFITEISGIGTILFFALRQIAADRGS